MSPDNVNVRPDVTSHTSGRGPEDLVPSRYALRVGGIDVLVISDGVLPLPAGVAHTLDELIAGEPLDAGAEAAARARGWQP